MDGYEADIARQPGGPFNKIQERKTIRRVAEHWVDRQRYSAEVKRRLQSYGWWLGLGGPVLLFGIKLAEAFWWKG